MRRLPFLFLGALLVLSTLPVMAGGGQQSNSADSGKIVLELQHHNTLESVDTSIESRAFHEFKNRFIKDHPEVTIHETIYQQVDNQVKMMALAAANEMPDIYMTKGSWVQNFYNNKLMADLTPYIDRSIYRPGLCDPLIRDGKLYAVPIQFALTSVVFWNAPMWNSIGFTEFPKTWEDLVKADSLFKAKGITTIAHGNKDKWMFESCILSALGDRFTGTAWTNSIIANDGKAKFTDPDFVTALRYSQQMASMFNRDFNAINNEQADALYGSGKAASIIEGSWTINYLLPNGDPDIVKNTRYAIIPSVPGMKGDPNSTSGGAWGMSASSKLTGDKLKAAATFLQYVSGKDYSQFMMDYNGSLGPCVAQINNRDSMPELSRNFIDYIGGVKVIPIYDIQMDGSVIDVMNSRLQELLGGTLTPEALAAAIQAEQDKIK